MRRLKTNRIALVVVAGLGALLGLLDWRDIDWRDLSWRDLDPRGAPTLAGTARVVDGDSLRLAGTDIRLRGLDAPELAQTCERQGRPWPCGEEARAALDDLLRGRPVTCRLRGLDRYRRTLARCSVGETDLGAALVARGLAVAYGDYDVEEALARRSRRGIWAGPFQRPEDWRAEHRRTDGPEPRRS